MTHSFRSIINFPKICILSTNCSHRFCSIYDLLKSTRSHNGFLDPYVGINSKSYIGNPQRSFCLYLGDTENILSHYTIIAFDCLMTVVILAWIFFFIAWSYFIDSNKHCSSMALTGRTTWFDGKAIKQLHNNKCVL